MGSAGMYLRFEMGGNFIIIYMYMQIQDKEGASKSVQILWLKFMQQTFILLSLLSGLTVGLVFMHAVLQIEWFTMFDQT